MWSFLWSECACACIIVAGMAMRAAQLVCHFAVMMGLAHAAQVGLRAAVQVCGLLRGWDHHLEARVQPVAPNPFGCTAAREHCCGGRMGWLHTVCQGKPAAECLGTPR